MRFVDGQQLPTTNALVNALPESGWRSGRGGRAQYLDRGSQGSDERRARTAPFKMRPDPGRLGGAEVTVDEVGRRRSHLATVELAPAK